MNVTAKIALHLIPESLKSQPVFIRFAGIEISYYEQKTFWSFGNYMVRSKAGIENYINFTAIVYSCVQLIPFQQTQYAHLQSESAQVKKQLFGMAIQEELFFYTCFNKVWQLRTKSRLYYHSERYACQCS